MSLWTPGGEHDVPRDDRPLDDGSGDLENRRPGDLSAEDLSAEDLSPEDLSPEEQARLEAMAREMAEVRQQLLQVPAATVVANHVMGLYELAAIHLSDQPPGLEEGRVAIDAMAAVVEALEGRLGDNEPVLRDALAQLRLAYVQLQSLDDDRVDDTDTDDDLDD